MEMMEEKVLEEEMEKKEQQSEFFGACQACNEKVTGAGQACQVRNISSSHQDDQFSHF